jgi:hypothetical protein
MIYLLFSLVCSILLNYRYPVLDYTCGCTVGYNPDLTDTRNCLPMCGDGLLQAEDNAIGSIRFTAVHVIVPKSVATRASTPRPPVLAVVHRSVAMACFRCRKSVTMETGAMAMDTVSRVGSNRSSRVRCRIDRVSCVMARGDRWLSMSLLLFPRFRALGYNLSGLNFTACRFVISFLGSLLL